MAIQVQVSIGQHGTSSIRLAARCRAGDHEALCERQLQPFKAELVGVLRERWPGCSPEIFSVLAAEEGVPPEDDWEPEPEPEPELEPAGLTRQLTANTCLLYTSDAADE